MAMKLSNWEKFFKLFYKSSKQSFISTWNFFKDYVVKDKQTFFEMHLTHEAQLEINISMKVKNIHLLLYQFFIGTRIFKVLS